MSMSKEFWEDVRWAEENYVELQRRYQDKWVAVFRKKVISYGENRGEVEKRAMELPNRRILSSFTWKTDQLYIRVNLPFSNKPTLNLRKFSDQPDAWNKIKLFLFILNVNIENSCTTSQIKV